jgi:uncharacterized membrane protein YfbV (UPF0208 family)
VAIKTGDEFEKLGHHFNTLAQRLSKGNQYLLFFPAEKEAQLIRPQNGILKVANWSLKIGERL